MITSARHSNLRAVLHSLIGYLEGLVVRIAVSTQRFEKSVGKRFTSMFYLQNYILVPSAVLKVLHRFGL